MLSITILMNAYYILIVTDDIDLLLQLINDRSGKIGAKNLVQIDELITWNRFICGQFDALLNLDTSDA